MRPRTRPLRRGTLARVEVSSVLTDVSALGPFFAVRTHAAVPDGPPPRPLAELEVDGPALRERIAYVRGALGGDAAVPLRVAASIAFQGIAAVVVSPAYAAAVLHATVPALGPATLHWQDVRGGPLPLWAPDPRGTPHPDALSAADALAAGYAEHLPALVTAVKAVVPVSERVLWGNVASVVAGAKRMVAAQRPAAADRAAAVAARLLDTGSLTGTGERLPPQDPDRHWTFRRRNCCLFYRVPGAGVCGDCVLTAPRRGAGAGGRGCRTGEPGLA